MPEGANIDLTGQPVARRSRLSPRAMVILPVLMVAALVAIGFWAVHYMTRGQYLESTDDAYISADAVTVSPKVAGYVEQVLVAENQDVRAGQPLVRIDQRDYKAQAAQFQAQIDVADANVENIRAGLQEQEAAIDQARAQLAVSQAEAQYAGDEVKRYAPLIASGAETHEKLISLRNQAAQASSTQAAQAAALVAAQRRIFSLQAQIRQAKAQGEAARAQLAAASVNLESTLVTASVDGRIGDETVRAGQFVTQGTRMMSVVPLQALYITANFKETQLGLMRPGQAAVIEVDALPGVTLRGHVQSVSPGTGAQFSLLPPQNATGNFTKIVQRVPVRIAIDAGPDARKILVPGLSVAVTVDTIGAKGDLQRIEGQEETRRRGS